MNTSDMRNLEKRLRSVEQATAKIDVRPTPGGGGGGGSGGGPSNDPGEPIVAEAPGEGAAAAYARADHTHLGMPWIEVDEIGDLPTDQPDGVVAHTIGADPGMYLYINGGWERLDTKEVLDLPDIPMHGKRFVKWISAGAGNGDDQVWMASKGDSKWTPTQRYSSKSGVPI